MDHTYVNEDKKEIEKICYYVVFVFPFFLCVFYVDDVKSGDILVFV